MEAISQNTPIYGKKVFTLTWGGFSGNLKKGMFLKSAMETGFFHIYMSLGICKITVTILKYTIPGL